MSQHVPEDPIFNAFRARRGPASEPLSVREYTYWLEVCALRGTDLGAWTVESISSFEETGTLFHHEYIVAGLRNGDNSERLELQLERTTQVDLIKYVVPLF